MKRTSETEPAAETGSALFTPVTAEVVQTLAQQAPRLREENRENLLHSLPDELMREIGKYLTLREWVALRELCKTSAEQVDRQPPFILLDPDVRTDALFEQFLKDATPEYAGRLGNLMAELNMTRATEHINVEAILQAIGKAQTWRVIKIDSLTPLAAFCRPLLQGLSRQGPGNIKRKLEYSNFLSKTERAIVEEVQRSASLQLTTLMTSSLSKFLPFIAASSEFSNLDVGLQNSATLTGDYFKALQQMQGSVKCMTLRSMGYCDANEILDAMKNKGLESLTLKESDDGDGVNLLRWLAMPLRSLKLDESMPDASTFTEAISQSKDLRVLNITGSKGFTLRDAQAQARALAQSRAKIDILLPALRMNQTIERLLLDELDPWMFIFRPADLLDVILNHSTINYLDWKCDSCVWPVLAAPKEPKAMDKVSLRIDCTNMIGITYLLQRLASLKRLRLEIHQQGCYNWEFLSIVSRLGVEEFTLCLNQFDEDESSISNNTIPFENCFWHGLRRLTLDLFWEGSKAVGMAAALGSATTVTSLQLNLFNCIDCGHELIKGLQENQSLERITLSVDVREEDASVIHIDVITAEIIEAIFYHPNISYAELDFCCYNCRRLVYIPSGYTALLRRLKPKLKLVLSSTTEIPPEEATAEEIQGVRDTYERIMKAAASRTPHS